MGTSERSAGSETSPVPSDLKGRELPPWAPGPSPSRGQRPRPKSRGAHARAAAAYNAPQMVGSQETLGGGGGGDTKAPTPTAALRSSLGWGPPASPPCPVSSEQLITGSSAGTSPGGRGTTWVWLPHSRAEPPPGRERRCRSRWSQTQRPWGQQGACLTSPSPFSCSASGRSAHPASCPASSAAGPAWWGPGTCPWSHCRGRGPLPG